MGSKVGADCVRNDVESQSAPMRAHYSLTRKSGSQRIVAAASYLEQRLTPSYPRGAAWERGLLLSTTGW